MSTSPITPFGAGAPVTSIVGASSTPVAPVPAVPSGNGCGNQGAVTAALTPGSVSLGSDTRSIAAEAGSEYAGLTRFLKAHMLFTVILIVLLTFLAFGRKK